MSSTHSGSSLDHTWPAKSDPGLTAMALLIRSRRSNPSPPFPGRHQTASVTSLPARGAQSSAYTQCVCDTMACQENSFHVRGEEEWVDHGVVIAPNRCIVLDPLATCRPSSLSPTCPSLGSGCPSSLVPPTYTSSSIPRGFARSLPWRDGSTHEFCPSR